MSPPGKNKGFTTNESVVNARRAPAIGITAWSSSLCSVEFVNAGRKSCCSSSALNLPPLPWPSKILSPAGSGTGHEIPFDDANFSVMKSHHSVTAISKVSRTGAFGRNHGRSQRLLRCAAFSKSRAFGWFFESLQHLCADAFGRLFHAHRGNRRESAGIMRRKLRTQAQAALGNHSDAPPLLVRDLKHSFHHFLRGHVACLGYRTHILVFHFGRTFFELGHEHQDGFQDVHRLEASDHNRYAEVSRELFILAVSHNGTHVTRRDKTLDTIFPGAQKQLDGGWNEHMRDEQKKIRQPFALRLPSGHGIGRGGGFKTDGKKYDALFRICTRNLERIHRRIDHTHVCAIGFGVEEVCMGAGYTQHVAVGNEDRVRSKRKLDGFVNRFHRCYADGTPRAVHKLHLPGQQLIQPVTHDGVGLAAANFHQNPGTLRDCADAGHQRVNNSLIPVFIEIFHLVSPGPGSFGSANSASSTPMLSSTW